MSEQSRSGLWRLRWLIVPLILVALLVSFATRNRLPEELVIATAAHGGLYHRLADALSDGLGERAGRSVSLRVTEGSAINRELLLGGDVELAIVQSGAVALDGLTVLAPLYEDVIHVLVRVGSAAVDIPDLRDTRIALGLPGSGMRVSAEALLRHYDVDVATLRGIDAYFGVLDEETGFDAAIVTTGLLNPDLESLLRSGDWSFLPIRDADSFCVRHPLYAPFSIPRGLYGETPPRPARATQTLATTALLVARQDVKDRLVEAVLAALFEDDLRQRIPTLMSASRAASWRQTPLHPTAKRYFDPYGGIDLLANFMESLAAIKELLVAFGASLYLLWTRRRWRQGRAQDAILHEMKERLDALLDRTAGIERALMAESGRDKLTAFLDEVTRIKLEALDELTHEDLRGDRMFLIFLIQCGALIERIQLKLASIPRA